MEKDALLANIFLRVRENFKRNWIIFYKLLFASLIIIAKELKIPIRSTGTILVGIFGWSNCCGIRKLLPAIRGSISGGLRWIFGRSGQFRGGKLLTNSISSFFGSRRASNSLFNACMEESLRWAQKLALLCSKDPHFHYTIPHPSSTERRNQEYRKRFSSSGFKAQLTTQNHIFWLSKWIKSYIEAHYDIFRLYIAMNYSISMHVADSFQCLIHRLAYEGLFPF